jgi:alpha-methylacyl-CoA racemase
MTGKLDGVRVVEFLGLGAAPFGCLFLADLGAEVLTISRPGQAASSMVRNRSLLELDLKTPEGLERALRGIAAADVVVESFRPMVLDRLGLTAQRMREHNPGLVIARMTGWGQDGPLAPRAGHDINYISLTGALDASRRPGAAPMPTANLIGDFGGGGMYLVIGVLAALVERQRTGRGDDIDIAIVDGVTYLTTMLHEYRNAGKWSDVPGTNRLDTGAPYYDSYPTSDDLWVSVGALETKFFDRLAAILELAPDVCEDREDPARWPRLREAIAAAIRRRSRAEWTEIAAAEDVCIAPVLSLAEAGDNPHMAARGILRGDAAHGWLPELPLGFVGSAPSANDLLKRWSVQDGPDTAPDVVLATEGEIR